MMRSTVCVPETQKQSPYALCQWVLVSQNTLACTVLVKHPNIRIRIFVCRAPVFGFGFGFFCLYLDSDSDLRRVSVSRIRSDYLVSAAHIRYSYLFIWFWRVFVSRSRPDYLVSAAHIRYSYLFIILSAQIQQCSSVSLALSSRLLLASPTRQNYLSIPVQNFANPRDRPNIRFSRVFVFVFVFGGGWGYSLFVFGFGPPIFGLFVFGLFGLFVFGCFTR